MDEQIKKPETIEYIVDGADPAVEDDGEWDNPPVEELIEEDVEYCEEENYPEDDIEAQELAAIEAEQEEEAQLDEQASVPAVRTKEDAIAEFQGRRDSLVLDIIDTEDPKAIKSLVDMFNLAQVKKSVIRMSTMDDLLDGITDQMKQRILKNANMFSNKDILDYMNAVTGAMDKAQKNITAVNAEPVINFNQQNNTVVINNDGPADKLSRESREKIGNAVQSMLAYFQAQQQKELFEELDVSEETTVYNSDDESVDIIDSTDEQHDTE